MPISECSFCGALTVTETGICSACEQMMNDTVASQSAETVTPPPRELERFPEGFEGFGNPASQPDPPAFSQPPQTFAPPPRRDFVPAFEPEKTSTCLRCGATIPRGMATCDACPAGRSKSVLKKLALVAAMLVLGYFAYDFGYEMVSARGVVRKYEKATGSGVAFDSIVFKGDVEVKNVAGFFKDKKIDMATVAATPGSNMEFTMVFQSSGKSAVELEQGGTTLFKQVYDGTKGWELSRVGGRPAIVDKNDGFGLRKMGVGIDDFDSVEFMDARAASDFAGGRVDNVKSIAQIKLGSETLNISERVCVKAVAIRNGKPETSVLVFDKSSGLLIGMIKVEKVGDKEVSSVILFDDYRRFTYKGSGPLSFFRSNQVSVPTKWTIAVSGPPDPQIPVPGAMVMSFTVADVSFDGIFNPAIFNRPPV